MRVIISGKTSDSFNLELEDGRLYEGYPPECLGEGDYISFTLETETGRIVDWDKEKFNNWFYSLKEVVSASGNTTWLR